MGGEAGDVLDVVMLVFQGVQVAVALDAPRAGHFLQVDRAPVLLVAHRATPHLAGHHQRAVAQPRVGGMALLAVLIRDGTREVAPRH
jgi:hypothetical protein